MATKNRSGLLHLLKGPKVDAEKGSQRLGSETTGADLFLRSPPDNHNDIPRPWGDLEDIRD